MLIYTGRTVHVVPGEQGMWNVVDLQRRGSRFYTKAEAVHYARQIAAADQPSQVVLFDEFGRMEPIAHYQLPAYPQPQAHNESAATLFDATVKALVIGGFAAAGIKVLGDLVDRVERDVKKESAKSRRSTKSTSRSRKA